MSTVKRFGLACCATLIIIGGGVWTNGFAFHNQDYIHLVKHRDQYGNLVRPGVAPPPAEKAPPTVEKASPSVEEAPPVIQKTVIPAQPKQYSFRNTQWGMSIPEVKTNENASMSWELQAPVLAAGDHRIGYRTIVQGIETFLSYSFVNNQLTTTRYLFESNDDDKSQCLTDYETVKGWIVQTYGPPQSEEQLWLDDLYRYSTELWGRAVYRGHLTLVAEWEIEGTSIVLLLNGGDDQVALMAEFTNMDGPSSTQLVSLPSDLLDL